MRFTVEFVWLKLTHEWNIANNIWIKSNKLLVILIILGFSYLKNYLNKMLILNQIIYKDFNKKKSYLFVLCLKFINFSISFIWKISVNIK